MRGFGVLVVTLLLLSTSVYAQEEEISTKSALFDLYMAHNMLFSKVMDLAHIASHETFSLEAKAIESSFGNPCKLQPGLFRIPAEFSPYGKLDEIDAFVGAIIKALEAAGAPAAQIQAAKAFLAAAERHKMRGDFKAALECKCKAYKVANGINENTVKCARCGDGVVNPPEQCDPPNGVTCDQNCQLIIPPFCGNGILVAVLVW